MKKTFLVLLNLNGELFLSQSVNDYKAVIVPLKFNFFKVEKSIPIEYANKI
jgi:hypothetical protein